MKTSLKFIAALALVAGAYAGPLPRALVPAQVKWVIHFDAERFREGKLGAYYTADLMPKHLADMQAKSGHDFGPFFRALKSATAYGTDFGGGGEQSAVLLLQSDAASVRGIKDFLAGADGSGKKARRIKDDFPLYRLDGNTLLATLHDGRVLLGKSQSHLHTAWEVMEDKQPNLSTTESFKELSDGTRTFILGVGAEGLGGNLPLPPKARMFGKTTGLRALLDERGDKLFLNIALQAESAEIATRMKAVVDGVLAWASMEKSDDANVQLLVESARVTAEGKALSLTVEYPVERALEEARKKAK